MSNTERPPLPSSGGSYRLEGGKLTLVTKPTEPDKGKTQRAKADAKAKPDTPSKA